MRSVLFTVAAALVLAAPARATQVFSSSSWLAQARCVHLHEGPWSANTGNGYFGGMQFSEATWIAAGGPSEPSFAHPGDPAYPFAASPRMQLQLAWVVWRRDGGTWRSWGTVGAHCAHATAG